MIFPTKPTRRQIIWGIGYLFFELLALPLILNLLPISLTIGKLNFLYFFINFVAVTLIFRSYLIQSLRDAVRVLFPTFWCALLGYLGYRLLSGMLAGLIVQIRPQFVNMNDVSVLYALSQDFVPMALGTILLAPVAEETLFRGMIFRGLYDRSPLGAYAVSMAAFAAVHLISYVGRMDSVMLLLSFLQYLPAGYCLCFAYRQSGNLLSPILLHMFVNAVAVFSTR